MPLNEKMMPLNEKRSVDVTIFYREKMRDSDF